MHLERDRGHEPILPAPDHGLAARQHRHVGIAGGIHHQGGGHGTEAALVVQHQVGDAFALLHHVHHPRQVEQGDAGRGHLLVQQAAHGEGIERYAGGQLAAALGVPAERRVALARLWPGQQCDAPLGPLGRQLPEDPTDHPVTAPVGAPAEPVRHQPRRAHAAELALPFDDQGLQSVTCGGQRGSDARRAATADHHVVGLANGDLPRLIGDSLLHESRAAYRTDGEDAMRLVEHHARPRALPPVGPCYVRGRDPGSTTGMPP